MILALLVACATSTGGSRVTFDAVATPAVAPTDAAEGAALVYTDAATGWTVTLTQAEVAVGPLYLWSEKPTLTGQITIPGIAVAYAGSDEFLAGYLRGEVLDQVVVDLVAGSDVSIGTGDGTAGQSLSAELWLEPPSGTAAGTLSDTFEFAGSAEKDGVVVPFAGSLTIDDSVVDPDNGQTAALVRRIRGIPVGGDLTQGGTLRLTADATKWLAGADFSDLLDTEPDADGVYHVASPSSVWSILYYQVRQSGTDGPWSLSLEP
jgi:hypothetical protein